MSSVKLVSMTKPIGIDGVNTAEEFVAYCARVSNPENQINSETAPRLLKYLITHKHFSPFEMVSITMEIKTTRDIGRQILRHRSFSFQEFSQRYAQVVDVFEAREARLQDNKNRQNSIKTDDKIVKEIWANAQDQVATVCRNAYELAIKNGIAKEQARAVLPEGMTKSTMYMSGSLRSWIHYCELRMANGTQLEHMEIAKKAWEIILKEFPSLSAILEKDEPTPAMTSAGQIQELKNTELGPITKDQIEKIVEEFIAEKHFIPQRESFVAPQPTWLNPYPSQKYDVVYHKDKDSY